MFIHHCMKTSSISCFSRYEIKDFLIQIHNCLHNTYYGEDVENINYSFETIYLFLENKSIDIEFKKQICKDIDL